MTKTAYQQKPDLNVSWEGLGFSVFELDNGIRVFVRPDHRFKSIDLKAVLYQPLGDRVTDTAVLPSVLSRGCRRQRDAKAIARFLESLYGARFSMDVDRMGEMQMLYARMNIVAERYLPGAKGNLRKGLEFLHRVLFEPVTVGGGLKPQYVEQEALNLRNYLESRINNRGAWAYRQCIEAMCADERYRFSAYGQLEEIDTIEPVSLGEHHRALVERAPMDVLISGDVDPVRTAGRVRDLFGGGPVRETKLPETEVRSEVETVRELERQMPVDQAHLVMGFRTGITRDHPLAAAASMYNGILGRYAHSKLFRNVREREGLAYSVGSSMDRVKGLMTISAGIDGGEMNRCRDTIAEQLDALRNGDISEEELESTRMSLCERIRSAQDSPGSMIETMIHQRYCGGVTEPESVIERLNAVRIEDIREVAECVRLDTVFFLHP
jgi:predicted Zn-dependent peptidase